MVKFIGTIEEYHKFIGPRIRNVIQAMTKRRKKQLNHICQYCKQTKELEAAHIKGKTRKNIIGSILNKYIADKESLIQIDLKEIEDRVIEAHKPIDKYFLFLCAKCHIEYDGSK